MSRLDTENRVCCKQYFYFIHHDEHLCFYRYALLLSPADSVGYRSCRATPYHRLLFYCCMGTEAGEACENGFAAFAIETTISGVDECYYLCNILCHMSCHRVVQCKSSLGALSYRHIFKDCPGYPECTQFGYYQFWEFSSCNAILKKCGKVLC